MRYVISDIHGCFQQYKKLLEKIHFTEKDTLYVLGDLVDRGPEPIKVVQDMMKRKNVIHIMGNHDYIMYSIMKKRQNSKKMGVAISEAEQELYEMWMEDGGLPTVEGLLSLSENEQNKILEYMENSLAYAEISYGDKKYILVHAGIGHCDPDKALSEYEIWDFIEGRTDYSERYFEDENIFVITGHTPTPLIRMDRKPEIFIKNGHIAIDCGCVFGGRLASYCIETGEIVYVRG